MFAVTIYGLLLSHRVPGVMISDTWVRECVSLRCRMIKGLYNILLVYECILVEIQRSFVVYLITF